MNPRPRFRFFLSSDARPIDAADALWRHPLPLAPPDAPLAPPRSPEPPVTYADYFETIRAYLSHNHFEPLMRIIPPSERCHRRRRFDEIRIYLEKHGAHYHPSRIVIPALPPPQTFVVNVAVTAASQKILKSDYANLNRLNRTYRYGFLPEVYHCGGAPLNTGRVLNMFLGRWLEGYHEFHAGPSSPNDGGVTVWDPLNGPRALSSEQIPRLYRRAAMILTAYYDPYRFEHISAWHHAAGDFVVRLENGQVDVKLITVRSYVPLLQGVECDAGTVIQALLLFLLKLSLQMRLDRAAGVGERIWLDDGIVPATLNGFGDGLRLQAEHGFIPHDLPAYFMRYFKACSRTDLFALLAAVAERTFSESPAAALIRPKLCRHLDTLYSAAQQPDPAAG